MPPPRQVGPAAGATVPWRTLFVIYAIGLTTGTHWPALVVSTPAFPALDKVVHAVAFGGLAFLLVMTRWIRGTVTLALVLVAWAAVDEVTQPLFQRYASWTDLAASLAGMAPVIAWSAWRS